MLTAKKFAANLATIRKNDESFRELIADSLTFAIFHARNHGQKTPFMDLCAAVPGWLQRDISKVALAKRKTSEEACQHEADMLVAVWWQSHQERKEAAKAQREARKAMAPLPKKNNATKAQETALPGNNEVVAVNLPEFCLVSGDDVVELSADEARELVAMVVAMRKPKLQAVA